MSDAQKIQPGYYKEVVRGQVGTGDTAKSASMENIWLAEINDSGAITMKLLDMNNQPSGYSEQAEAKEIGTRFEFMPGFAPKVKNPKQDQADSIAARGERHLENEEYLSAEFEFSNAIKLDGENVRANFGLGKTYVAQGDTEKASEIFDKLAQIDAVLEPENKHIFNECGIQMRQLGMHQQAVSYYHRALRLAQNDENLWFNLGRALFESGKSKEAKAAFDQAVRLNPEFDDAKGFSLYIQKKSQ
jgi:tetratricopeptide (TPR) repeat protein